MTDTSASDKPAEGSPESDARKTIDHLTRGTSLSTDTIKDVKRAADRAVQNRAVSGSR